MNHHARWIHHPLMVKIARDNLSSSLSILDKINLRRQSLLGSARDEWACIVNTELSPALENLYAYSTTTIVFSALAVEAYIYDYAARNLHDKFVESHLDKLDIISKLVVIPKLVTGKDFPKDKKAFNLIYQLVKNRNSIVHAKSKKIHLDKLIDNPDDFVRFRVEGCASE